MKTRIQKWGNSLALRIPKTLAQETGLDAESEVELSLVNGQIVIAPTRPAYDLDDLLAQITDANRHSEVNTGAAVGHEVW
jgi:antitoxin MazE